MDAVQVADTLIEAKLAKNGLRAFDLLTKPIDFGSLPDGLPIIGGALTWNALLYGAASAMAITAMMREQMAMITNCTRSVRTTLIMPPSRT